MQEVPIRLAFLPAVTLLLGACATWHVVPATPEALANGPTRIGVIQQAGDTLVLRDPAVERDSIVGWSEDEGELTRHAIAVTDANGLVVQSPNYEGSIIGGIGLGLLGATLFLVAAVSGLD